MKRLILLPLLVGAVQAETLYYDGTPRWISIDTTDPFPNPVLFNADGEGRPRDLAWGDDTSHITPAALAFLPQGGGSEPSMALFDDRGGPIQVDGSSEIAGILTHMNNPQGDWWEPGDRSSHMSGDAAYATMSANVRIFADIARTQLLLDIVQPELVTHFETHNDGDPPDGPGEIGEGHTFVSDVDDLFTVSSPVTQHPFDYNGLQYVATVSLFHPPGDLDSTQTDFWSPEGGQSEAQIGLRITQIPEPSMVLLLGLGLFVIWRKMVTS